MVYIPPLQFGIPGGPELLVILLIAVLLFGANKIPKLARSTGEAMGEFQKGREEVEQELEEMRDGKPKNEPGTSGAEPDVETGESEDAGEAETETGTETETETESEGDDEPEIVEAEEESSK